jgi:hypothetical protein
MGVLGDGCGDVGHADAHAYAAIDSFRKLDLIEIARGVVIDRRPEQAALVTHIAVECGRRCRANVLELLRASGREIRLKALAHHLGGRRCGEIEGMVGHGVSGYHGAGHTGGRACGASR